MRSLDDIFQKKRSLDEIFAPSPQFSKEDIAKVKANNEEYAKRVKESRPFFDKNPVGRLGVAVAQGISNSALNPAGYVARAFGMDTKPFTPQNAVERGVEKAGEYGYDALALGGVGNIAKGAGYLGKGNTVTSKVLQDVFSPENLVTMAFTPAVGGGFAEGVVNPTNEFERTLVNVVGGGALGGLASGVKQTSKPINKGLKGALPDNEANKALSKGIRASEEVAEQVSSQAPSAYNSLNDEMENALNKAVGRKLNYEKSISNQQERIDDFIGKNADKELFSSKSAKQQAKENFNKWFEGSKVVDDNGEPLVVYHGTDANFDAFDPQMIGKATDNGFYGKGFYFTRNKGEASSYGNKVLPSYLKSKNMFDIRGVDGGYYGGLKDNMFEKGANLLDDLGLLNADQVEKYNFYKEAKNNFLKNVDIYEPSDVQDIWFGELTMPDGTKILNRAWESDNTRDGVLNVLWNDYARRIKYKDGTYLDHLLDGMSLKDYMRSDGINPQRFSDKLKSMGYDGVYQGDEFVVFEPNQIKSVKNSGAWSSSPSLTDAGWTPKASLKSFTQGLDEFQTGALTQAINKGATMSTNSKGSLGATHRAQEVLNDMIEASYDTSIIGQKKPTTETRELMGVKDRLKQILEPSGIKPYDASYSKAQALKSAFEKGYNFKPSELKFENMGLATRRDKQAFLQGRMQKLLDNTLSDGGTNLATVIKKDENTLKKLMSKDKFDNLMNTADKIETQFKRLKSLEGQANRRLVKDTTTGSSINRENFESRGAMLGRLSDMIGGAINRGRNIDIAKQYLNSDELVTRGGLKGFLKGSGTAGTRQLLIDLLNNE